jgi:hypothetical protein
MTQKTYWDSKGENLRCHIELDRNVARQLSRREPGGAFLALVVEDRSTHQIGMKFRYGDRRWHFVATDKPDKEGVEYCVSTITMVLRLTAAMVDVELRDDQIRALYPPEDPDPVTTLIWLEVHDLIDNLGDVNTGRDPGDPVLPIKEGV